MAYMINKTTLEEKPKASTPDCNSKDWFLISDLSHAPMKWPDFTILPTTVLNILTKYRKVKNDNIVEMTTIEKAAADQTIAEIKEEQNKLTQKEILINNKVRDIAINALIADGILDENGDLISYTESVVRHGI